MAITNLNLIIAYLKYKALDKIRDLQREKLSLTDYETLREVLQECVKRGKSNTLNKSVADFCERYGLSVKLDQYGASYDIEVTE